ncbi:hypothetical protein [Pseudoalteromonas sp. 20-MNA-CIBAN-0454]|uniref:hypothetical protein n=1 Tax=Pseudoalteromonas sp. 20-MNA-CIBAN-0454 TaxID=3140424 RepID=UPI003326CE57
MKKLIVLSAIAALTSGAALAQSINLTGNVDSICNVSTIGSSSASFAELEVGTPDVNIGVEIQCNDPDGATVSLITSEGHLQNADQEDKGVGYWATLDAAPFNFTLKADDGQNDKPNSQTILKTETAKVAALANGVSGNITLSLKETALFSGTYADTLAFVITVGN